MDTDTRYRQYSCCIGLLVTIVLFWHHKYMFLPSSYTMELEPYSDNLYQGPSPMKNSDKTSLDSLLRICPSASMWAMCLESPCLLSHWQLTQRLDRPTGAVREDRLKDAHSTVFTWQGHPCLCLLWINPVCGPGWRLGFITNLLNSTRRCSNLQVS